MASITISKQVFNEKTMTRQFTVNNRFQPLPTSEGDELYRNGIFEFNITQLLGFIKSKPTVFQMKHLLVNDLRRGISNELDENTIQTAIISNPIILAEIAPDQFNVIDGNHRLEKAYRDGIEIIPTYKILAEQHIAFLTSVTSYKTYIHYWNDKLKNGSLQVKN